MSAFFPFYPLNTNFFFFFCFLISLSRFRANATNRNEFEYIKRIKIHPCVNETHSRIFSIENACCVCVFGWFILLFLLFQSIVQTIQRKRKQRYENEQLFVLVIVFGVSVQRTAPDVDFTAFQFILLQPFLPFTHFILNFYFLLLLFAVRHSERRGLLKNLYTYYWMRQSSAHRSWPLLLLKLLLLCWYLWNSDGFNHIYIFIPMHWNVCDCYSLNCPIKCRRYYLFLSVCLFVQHCFFQPLYCLFVFFFRVFYVNHIHIHILAYRTGKIASWIK